MFTRWYGRSGSSSSVGQRARGVVNDLASPPSTTTRDAVQDAARSQHIDQLQQRLLSLRSDHEVDERRLQHRVGVLRREIAAPHDGNVGTRFLHPATDCDRLSQLRPGHHGHREERDLRAGNGGQPLDDLRGRIAGDVAVDEHQGSGVRPEPSPPPRRVEHRCERHQRERQRLFSRSRRERVVEHDHRTTHSPKAAGARRSLTRDRCRRIRHPIGPRVGTNCACAFQRSAIAARAV